MEMTFVHWKVTKAVNLGENLITRGGSNATPEQQLGAAFPYNLGARHPSINKYHVRKSPQRVR
jgi:hypothetical protein